MDDLSVTASLAVLEEEKNVFVHPSHLVANMTGVYFVHGFVDDHQEGFQVHVENVVDSVLQHQHDLFLLTIPPVDLVDEPIVDVGHVVIQLDVLVVPDVQHFVRVHRLDFVLSPRDHGKELVNV